MIFLISNSTCALLIYRKAINQLFYIYLLSCNLAIIAYLFQECFMNAFGFSAKLILSSVNIENVIFYYYFTYEKVLFHFKYPSYMASCFETFKNHFFSFQLQLTYNIFLVSNVHPRD